VLHVAPAFYPATYWGGPTTSVYELCNGLARNPEIHLRVLTTDTAGPRTQDRLSIDERMAGLYKGYRVTFCRKLLGVDTTPSLWLAVWREVSWADVVHLAAVYSTTTLPVLAATRLLRKPLVWSPRGALQKWTRSRNVPLKSAWDALCRQLMNPKSTTLHATSEEEKLACCTRMKSVEVAVVPNGVHVPDRPRNARIIGDGDILNIIYLGRLHPIKGIENLLHALTVPSVGPCRLNIYGTGDARYTRQLRRLVHELGLEDRVAFIGHVAGCAKHEAFLGADLCVVPSYSENFGLVVAEALGHGVPVIASTGTPWKALDDRGAGLWLSNDPDSLASGIAMLRNKDLSAMGVAGRKWMSADYSWDSICGQMIDVYKNRLGVQLPKA
jgi:glycosyltransferase involved in cell wall biosynthesis